MPPQRRWVLFRATRAGVVLAVGLVATVVPGFGVFVSLIGSLCCAVLAFVIPTLAHLRLFGHELNWCAPRAALFAFTSFRL